MVRNCKEKNMSQTKIYDSKDYEKTIKDIYGLDVETVQSGTISKSSLIQFCVALDSEEM